MKIEIGQSNCGCQPTEEDKKRVLSNLRRDTCVHCGKPMIPAVVEITCFCSVDPQPPDSDPWGARIIDVEKGRVIYVNGLYKHIHEFCMRIALPFLNIWE